MSVGVVVFGLFCFMHCVWFLLLMVVWLREVALLLLVCMVVCGSRLL